MSPSKQSWDPINPFTVLFQRSSLTSSPVAATASSSSCESSLLSFDPSLWPLNLWFILPFIFFLPSPSLFPSLLIFPLPACHSVLSLPDIVSEVLSRSYGIHCNWLSVYILKVPHIVTRADLLLAHWHTHATYDRNQDRRCAQQLLQAAC